MPDVARVLPCCVSDGVTGVLWGPLQPHHSLGPTHLLQLSAQTALQEHLLLLPSAHVQAEGGEAALHRWETDHSHLPIHPHLQLWRVQLNSDQQHLEASAQPQFHCSCQIFPAILEVCLNDFTLADAALYAGSLHLNPPRSPSDRQRSSLGRCGMCRPAPVCRAVSESFRIFPAGVQDKRIHHLPSIHTAIFSCCKI